MDRYVEDMSKMGKVGKVGRVVREGGWRCRSISR